MSRTPKPGAAPALPSFRKGLKGFTQDLTREMKNVTWPTPQETTRLAGVVVGLCAAIVIFLFGLSFVCEQGLRLLGGRG